MRRVCVFCGSNVGNVKTYVESARLLGRLLVERQLGLVYGGAGVGLMGELARAVSESGGEVIGIMPSMLVEKELALDTSKTDMRIVSSLHERKALMAELSEGFIAMPGGFGTLDEFFEILTHALLRIHAKPCGILNFGGYYDDLLRFLRHAVARGFIKAAHFDLILVETEPARLLDRFEQIWKTGKGF